MRGKLILIEGTDCSGKETQTDLLKKRLKEKGIDCVRIGFPDYDSPTGKIIGGPYLGKEYITKGFFPEGAANVDPRVSSLYFAADFLYHLKNMNDILDSGKHIILDRYFYSSFAHQGGKYENTTERYKMYNWLSELFIDNCGLIEPDIKVFLHMPYEVACKLKKNRKEAPDQHESSKKHLLLAEEAYMEIAELYDFKTIECNIEEEPRKIEDINNELFDYVLEKLENKKNYIKK